jgi:hypothetical protein
MTPTYRNDSTTQTWRGQNFSGEAVNVAPGEFIGTRDLVIESFMTKTSDLPSFSPTISWSTVSLGVGCSGEVSFNSILLSGLDILNTIDSSGEALVYFQTTAAAGAALAARLQAGRAISFTEAETLHKVSKVVIESSLGSVVEVRGTKK